MLSAAIVLNLKTTLFIFKW